MIIRKAVREDAGKIAAVHVQSWREAYKGIMDQGFLNNLDEESRIHFWSNRLDESNATGLDFVAESDYREIVGFASFGDERTKQYGIDSELYAIYILDAYKGRKVGTHLLFAGVEEVLRKGKTSLLVWVLAENQSRKFYESFFPEKVGEESVTIGGQEFIELAYGWKDLVSLKEVLMKKIESR